MDNVKHGYNNDSIACYSFALLSGQLGEITVETFRLNDPGFISFSCTRSCPPCRRCLFQGELVPPTWAEVTHPGRDRSRLFDKLKLLWNCTEKGQGMIVSPGPRAPACGVCGVASPSALRQLMRCNRVDTEATCCPPALTSDFSPSLFCLCLNARYAWRAEHKSRFKSDNKTEHWFEFGFGVSVTGMNGFGGRVFCWKTIWRVCE